MIFIKEYFYMLHRQTVPLDEKNFVTSTTFKPIPSELEKEINLRHAALLTSTNRVDADIIEDILYKHLFSNTENENLISFFGFYGFSFSQNKFIMHLFLPCKIHISLANVAIKFHIFTDYPKGNEININIYCHTNVLFIFATRVPNWCKNSLFYVNDTLAECKVRDGYVYIKRIWQNEDCLRIILSIPHQGLPFLS